MVDAVHDDASVTDEFHETESPLEKEGSSPGTRSSDQHAEKPPEAAEADIVEPGAVIEHSDAEGLQTFAGSENFSVKSEVQESNGDNASEPESVASNEPESVASNEPESVAPNVRIELRQRPMQKRFVPPRLISLELVDNNDTFSFRTAADADISALATDLARLGQLSPIDVRPLHFSSHRFQIITGFRRVAALRFLQRDQVLAWQHAELSDEDALLMALAAAIHGQPVSRNTLLTAQTRLSAAGKLTPIGKDMLEQALSGDVVLPPEHVDEEIDAEEFATDVIARLGQCNQDLSLLVDVFDELERTRQDELRTQLSYASQLVAYFEQKEKE